MTTNAKNLLKNNLSQHASDPNFMAILDILPNPDTVLQKMGVTQQVYDDIMSDAHVLGEIRSVRTGILSYERKINPGGDSAADMQAYELCQNIFNKKPAPNLRWTDITWSMAQAPFRGMSVLQIKWLIENGKYLPESITDWKSDRFIFDQENQIRLLTKDQPVKGIELKPEQWLINRHMASSSNPYGVALLSACFWPYTFKHGGFKFFVKFCEKYGLPWAIAKYPQETKDEEQQKIADDLADMVEDAVGAFPKDSEVELLTTSVSGELVHERLIHVCNAEISKVLTSQTLATEINGQGSRAASETHREREKSVNESDRDDIADTYNQLFEWVTELNFPPGTRPPTYELYKEEEARIQWAKMIDAARKHVEVPQTWAYRQMQIPEPKDGEATLPLLSGKSETPAEFAKNSTGNDFSSTSNALDEIDKQLENGIIEPLYDMLLQYEKDGKTLKEFQEDLPKFYSQLDQTGSEKISTELMQYIFAKGMSDAS
jgi:phage gp29-like protein